MEEMLKAHGFDDVRIRPDAVPRHLIDALKLQLIKDDDWEEGDENPLTAIEYYRVTTKQGSFGFFVTEYPVLDLTGTGLSLNDFCLPDDLPPLPPDFPPVVPVADSDILLLLWQLLMKKNSP
jgi:hypothetical protein